MQPFVSKGIVSFLNSSSYFSDCGHYTNDPSARHVQNFCQRSAFTAAIYFYRSYTSAKWLGDNFLSKSLLFFDYLKISFICRLNIKTGVFDVDEFLYPIGVPNIPFANYSAAGKKQLKSHFNRYENVYDVVCFKSAVFGGRNHSEGLVIEDYTRRAPLVETHEKWSSLNFGHKCVGDVNKVDKSIVHSFECWSCRYLYLEPDDTSLVMNHYQYKTFREQDMKALVNKNPSVAYDADKTLFFTRENDSRILYYLPFLKYTLGTLNSTLSGNAIAYRTYTKRSRDNWMPFVIDNVCPVYVVCRTGDGGFGDRLEHYIYYMNIAKLLQATLVYDIAPEACLQEGQTCTHNPTEYLFVMSEILGVNITFNSSSLDSIRKTATIHQITFFEAKLLEESILEGVADVQCNSIYESNIYSCNNQWCPTSVEYNFVENVKWHLRANRAVQACSDMKYGFRPNSSMINVVWHIRNGDICLHCHDLEYVRNIYKMLLSTLDVSENESNNQVTFHIESSDPVPELQSQFPTFVFHNGQTVSQSSFTKHVCRVLTSDVYISTGSSLVILGAFGAQNRPIIFEEERKNQQNEIFKQRHIFSETDVIWMFNGVPSKPFYEIKSIIKSSLAFKLVDDSIHGISKNSTIAITNYSSNTAK
jgi:hypothetical protein